MHPYNSRVGSRHGLSSGRRWRTLLSAALSLMALLPALGAPMPTVATDSDAAFVRTWARTDAPVAGGAAARTWMWGPEPISDVEQEPYAEAPGGQRAVQYYDKSRMEVTHPDAIDDGVWYVTNGLLAKELITGEMQTGDNQWEYRLPAEVNVVGDPGRGNGPTYATLRERVQIDPLNIVLSGDVGDVLSSSMDAAGRVTADDARFAAYDIRIGALNEAEGAPTHTIAAPFWEFMTSRGLVQIDGELVEDALFPNPFYATGLPLTEPYWTTALVGGTAHDVLFQCFERRCLTYTPGNPAGWQVESGNIGQHYQQWRNVQPPDIEGEILFVRTNYVTNASTSSLHLINADGTDERTLLDDVSGLIEQPRWSPDGSHVAFMLMPPYSVARTLMLLDVGTGALQQVLADKGPITSFDWSPDSTRLVVAANPQLFLLQIDQPQDVQQLTGLTPETAQEINGSPAWSPDGEWIAYASRGTVLHTLSNGIAVMRPDGTDLRDLNLPDGYAHTNLQWSADSRHVLAERQPQAGRDAWGGAVIRVWEEGPVPGHQIVVSLLAGCTWDVCARNQSWAPTGVALEPDGTTIALQTALMLGDETRPAHGLGTRGLALIDTITGAVDQILAYGSDPSWSPDGQHIVFMHQLRMSHRPSEPRIGITTRDGSVQWLVVNNASQPQWRPIPPSAS